MGITVWQDFQAMLSAFKGNTRKVWTWLRLQCINLAMGVPPALSHFPAVLCGDNKRDDVLLRSPGHQEVTVQGATGNHPAFWRLASGPKQKFCHNCWWQMTGWRLNTHHKLNRCSPTNGTLECWPDSHPWAMILLQKLPPWSDISFWDYSTHFLCLKLCGKTLYWPVAGSCENKYLKRQKVIFS